MTVTAKGKLTNQEIGGGRTRQRFPVEFEALKVRDGQQALPERLVMVSERNADNRLDWMTLERDDEADSWPDEVLAFLDGKGAQTRAEIATALGLDSKDGRLTRALVEVESRGKVRKVSRGMYEAI